MARTPGREEWEAAKTRGLNRYVAIGALRRGTPMALGVLVILEVLDGGSFTRERFLSPDFAERVLFVFSVFLIGGAIAAFARWKSFESLYGRDGST